MGGSNDITNLVELTLDEHAEAHKLLWEQYGKWQDYIAWKALSGQIDKEEIIRKKISFANKGRTFTQEHRMKLRLVKLGKKREQRTPEHCKKISELKSKTWFFKDPIGKKIVIKNLNQFCKENNLNRGNMIMVYNGQRNHHKGYTI